MQKENTPKIYIFLSTGPMGDQGQAMTIEITIQHQK
jgi:hypothetical protein